MRDTDYAKRFLDGGKPVMLLPVVFVYKGKWAVIRWEELHLAPCTFSRQPKIHSLLLVYPKTL